jgi:hypothetical protein
LPFSFRLDKTSVLSREAMPIQIERQSLDPDRGRFKYAVQFTRRELEDDDIVARVPVEVAVSVSENGDLADMSFVVPKQCRTPEALSLIKVEPGAQQVESRVFISIPGASGDSVLNSTAELQLDAAGRIVGMAIHPF